MTNSPDIERVLDDAFRQLPSAELSATTIKISRVEVAGGNSVLAPAAPVIRPRSVSGWITALANLLRRGTPNPFDGVLTELIAISDQPQEQHVPNGLDSTVADTYGIGLPPGWVAQPLDPAAFRRALAEQKAQLVGQGIDRTDIRRFELLQRQVHDQLLAEDVRYVATLAARPPGAEEGALVLAGLVISTRTRDQLAAPGPITSGMLLRGFDDTTSSREDGINLEPPAEVELPLGRAVRLVRFHGTAPTETDRIEFYEHAYLAPHDGGDRVGFLQLVTPTLGLTEPLGELFDALAATWHAYYPNDPTTFDVRAGGETV